MISERQKSYKINWEQRNPDKVKEYNKISRDNYWQKKANEQGISMQEAREKYQREICPRIKYIGYLSGDNKFICNKGVKDDTRRNKK